MLQNTRHFFLEADSKRDAFVTYLHWQRFDMHLPMEQSVGTLHTLPGTQTPHILPPQSLSVSFPFVTLSMQVGPKPEVLN